MAYFRKRAIQSSPSDKKNAASVCVCVCVTMVTVEINIAGCNQDHFNEFFVCV